MNQNKILDARRLIQELYNTIDGGVGGYGHIVFDDGNIDTSNIIFCLRNAYNKVHNDDICEETRLASISALEMFLLLNEDERELALSNDL